MDDTKITQKTDIQTSQQKRGEYSLPEGHGGGGPGAGPNLFGNENAPTGLSTKASLAEPFKTSQQIKGEYSLPES